MRRLDTVLRSVRLGTKRENWRLHTHLWVCVRVCCAFVSVAYVSLCVCVLCIVRLCICVFVYLRVLVCFCVWLWFCGNPFRDWCGSDPSWCKHNSSLCCVEIWWRKVVCTHTRTWTWINQSINQPTNKQTNNPTNKLTTTKQQQTQNVTNTQTTNERQNGSRPTTIINEPPNTHTQPNTEKKTRYLPTDIIQTSHKQTAQHITNFQLGTRYTHCSFG